MIKIVIKCYYNIIIVIKILVLFSIVMFVYCIYLV